ncbi:MAG: magnesium transporter [Candidatus Azotimanducaceae bacterium]|jgi:magnesium transporter
MITAVAFDFDLKTIEAVQLADVAAAIAADQFCWIDFDNLEAAVANLPALGIGTNSIARLQLDERHHQARHGETCVHFALAEVQMADANLTYNVVHAFLTDDFIATVHNQPSALIERVRGTYQQDFHTRAETGGFLLFELADHLIIGYREALSTLATNVAGIQRRLLGDVGDEILTEVSNLTRALLEFRNAVVGARETIDELATRRSSFVPESTQPFLDRQTVPLDRLAQDAATERTVLSEVLNLYMGIVSHRTNKVVNRLTVVSMIVLPLNFLAAVFGMNFEKMPGLASRYGYAGFWVGSLLLVVSLLIIFRRERWI